MDAVITPTHHAAFSLTNDDTNNIHVVGYPVRSTNNKASMGLELTTEKNFLSVAQWSPRERM